jgi:hypothetical protein
MLRLKAAFWAVLALAAFAGSASAVEWTTGNPKIQSIEAIAFSPDGILIVGDGKGSQVVAIQTDDKSPTTWTKTQGKDIKEEIGARLGTTGKGIEIKKLIAHPISKKAYLAVRKLDNKQDVLVAIAGDGTISEVALDNVKHHRYALPTDPKASTNASVTDVTVTDGRVLLAVGGPGNQFQSKIYSIDIIEADAAPAWISTDTYHVAHGKWETNAPIRTVIPYTENGKKYIVGAFTCTPIVKYSLDDLKAGARVRGQSMIELGNGNTPQDMFMYTKNGKSYILINNVRMGRFHESNPVGPSPYWTAKVDQSILGDTEKINEKALQRLGGGKGKASESAIEQAVVVPEFHGVTMMDKLDDDRALVIRTDDKGGYTMAVLRLP